MYQQQKIFLFFIKIFVKRYSRNYQCKIKLKQLLAPVNKNVDFHICQLISEE